MGSSSSGKKHKKDKKHRHRSVEGIDEGESSSSHRHHKHKRHKEHKERHRHKKHRERDHDREKERHQHSEVIALEESDSDDSSDCVEVPLDDLPLRTYQQDSDTEREAPPPPQLSKHHVEREKEYERLKELERARDREIEKDWAREREREKEKERYEREREVERRKEKEMERERMERERDREKERARDRDRELREKDRERMERERERDRLREREQRVEYERSHRERERERERDKAIEKTKERQPREKRSPSPIPENGAGDCLSIEETNKLRAKLGLKPLEVESGPSKPTTSAAAAEAKKVQPGEKDLSSYKDEWGEFLHKPATNLKEKAEAEKMREKLKQRKEKRFLEEQLARIRTLGESDEETDDVSKWVSKNRRVIDERKEAQKRAKMIEEMDAEFGVNDLVEKEKEASRRKAYNDKHLKGLRVEHDLNEFTEGKQIILTLKDKDVLDDEDDALINVNLVDDERYRKNVVNKKQNPLSYGYNVYEEQYDKFGNPIQRGILEKYDEDLDGNKKKNEFVIGDNVEEQREHQRKVLEIKTKLAGKRLETLEDAKIALASDTYSEAELTKFKKPKKKVKKIRKKLKVEDLIPMNDEPMEKHLGSRRGRHREEEDMDTEDIKEVKVEDEDEDLERILSKARKLKQKENIIRKNLPIDVSNIKHEIKDEPVDGADGEGGIRGADGNIVLNATAEFCRTLGDIPTYGMAGNRDEDSNDMMDFEINDGNDERLNDRQNEPELNHGTWNSVNPDEVMQPAEFEDVGENLEEVAILDEEPDVSAGVANALRLALSKGYLEKEEHNRPSNSKMAHLQAKNYSIEDKSAVEDDKFGRRDRFHAGPIMEFKDKETFKPNVKLEYIDDNGRILNSKEAFRYLSHKFHGKGPGKNKIEKRLKKMEQEGLMKTMSSTDTPLGTLTMLQQKQKETKTPFVVLSGGKQTAAVSGATISKYK
uniref:U4/U6.U5 tri-snRNP-associated protein 1 n=2 Tax=Ceratitis capitata TaxID=7213 RepID=W8BAP2_CERCA